MIFKRFSEFSIHLATLAEAEGRQLRHSVARLGLGFSFTLVGAGLLLVGAVLLLAALWLGVHREIGEAWASAVTGMVAMLMAGGAIYAAIRLHK